MIKQRRLFESSPVRKRIRERTISGDAQHRVDREVGVIRDCAILGRESANGRIYDDSALDKAVELYEGVIVRVNHDPEGHRSICEDIGVLKNIRRVDSKVRGDFHLIKSHEKAEYFCERAEKFPTTFGFSHEADGLVVEEEDGTLRVVDLVYVESVDLVGSPATNMSLFEGVQKMVKKSIRSVIRGVPAKTPGRKRMLEMLDDSATSGDVEIEKEATPEEQLDSALKATIQAITNDPDLSVEEKLAKISALVGAPVAESDDPPEPKKEEVPESDTPAEVESKTVPESDDNPAGSELEKMTESIKKSLRSEFSKELQVRDNLIKTLTEQNESNVKRLKLAEETATVRKMFEDSGVKATDEQVETALALKGKQRESYVSTLKALTEAEERGGSPRSSGAGGGEPVGAFPDSTEGFVKALRG